MELWLSIALWSYAAVLLIVGGWGLVVDYRDLREERANDLNSHWGDFLGDGDLVRLGDLEGTAQNDAVRTRRREEDESCEGL